MATIGGNLFTGHPKNLNHVHKESNDILSVIIILGTNFHGGETVFNDGESMKYIGKRAHVLNPSNGRCVVDAFDKILHEVSIWNSNRDVISFILHKSIFLHFVHKCTKFNEKYITSDDKKKYIDHDGSGVVPKQYVRKRYNAKYKKTYSNQYYVLENDYIKDTTIGRTYS